MAFQMAAVQISTIQFILTDKAKRIKNKMSALREFAGLRWSDWTPTPDPDIADYSLSPSPTPSIRQSNTPTPTEITPNSSRSHSPIHRSLTPTDHRVVSLPPTDDVMKLPRKDMHIFGLCPVQGKCQIIFLKDFISENIRGLHQILYTY